METVEQVDENFNVKKPKKKGWLISGIILGTIVIALTLFYFLVLTKPQFIFGKAIDKLFETDSKYYDSIKVGTEIKASIETEDETYEEYLKEIEKVTLKAGTQMDISDKKEIVELGLEYDDEAVADAQLYYDGVNMYAYLDGLFDKYIEIYMDEESKEQLNKIFESATVEKNIKTNGEGIHIFKEELKKQIKDEGKFEQEKETINIGNKEQKVTKSTLILSEKQMLKILSNICSNLAENDEFIVIYEDIISKKDLKELAKELKAVEANSKNKVEISIYTQGLLNNKFVGTDVEVYSDIEESTSVIKIVKESKNVYAYDVFVKADKQKNEILQGKVEIEKNKETKEKKSGKVTVSAKITELGSAELEVDYAVEYNKGIDKINTKNSVNIEDLTEEDVNGIMEKLMERPLIGDYLKTIMETSMGNETVQLTTTQNEVKDYGYSVTYSVPTEFIYKTDYSTDYLKYYVLEDIDYSYIDASVEIVWSTEEEYITDDIDWDYEYYSQYHKNTNLSEEKVITVGDKQFKYRILSTETTYDTKEETAYVWYKLDDEHLFVVELEATDKEVTEDMIKGFLDINVKEI